MNMQQKSILYVPEVFTEDTGMFTVRAQNPLGMVECRANVTITGQLCF